jgi:hypothetical protein
MKVKMSLRHGQNGLILQSTLLHCILNKLSWSRNLNFLFGFYYFQVIEYLSGIETTGNLYFNNSTKRGRVTTWLLLKRLRKVSIMARNMDF